MHRDAITHPMTVFIVQDQIHVGCHQCTIPHGLSRHRQDTSLGHNLRDATGVHGEFAHPLNRGITLFEMLAAVRARNALLQVQGDVGRML